MNSTGEMKFFDQLNSIRQHSGQCQTIGLSVERLNLFSEDSDLIEAVEQAWQRFNSLSSDERTLLKLPEEALIATLQNGYQNFYPDEAINPYVPLAAKGSWVVTTHGAVVFDCGGYGMLGLGHAPDCAIKAMNAPYVMANIMTASLSQHRLNRRLRETIGFRRGHCPFEKFLCLNSGSESVTIAFRIADANAKVQTSPGTTREGWQIKALALKGAFHGRTDRPASVSDSSRPRYEEHLASFRNRDNLIIVPGNDCKALRQAFAKAKEDKIFIEAMFLEPVQGEGNPGISVTREFYDLARKLTKEHDTMLIADSIQAGLRGQGCLSIVDYPGFEDCEAPDMETWSKALNAGQYPLSVLGLAERAASSYRRGIYGNTMTTNPRALEVACAVMDEITPAIQENIRERGREFIQKLTVLKEKYPKVAVRVQGTGLLFAMELKEEYPVTIAKGIEWQCRVLGLGIIHGGKNALRFTPSFLIESKEVDLIIDVLDEVFSDL